MCCRNMSWKCVFGCDTYGVPVHGFPNPIKYPDIFQTWISVLPEGLNKNDVKKFKMCDYHFKPEHRTRGHGLSKIAVPLLYLNGVPKLITNFNNEYNYCLPRIMFWSEPNSAVQQLGSETSQHSDSLTSYMDKEIKTFQSQELATTGVPSPCSWKEEIGTFQTETSVKSGE